MHHAVERLVTTEWFWSWTVRPILGMCMLFVTFESFRFCQSARLAMRLFRNGPPEVAKQLLAGVPEPNCAVRTERMLGYGKVTFVSR